MKKNIKKAREHHLRKALSLAVGSVMLLGQMSPLVALAFQKENKPNTLMSQASPADIQRLQDFLYSSDVESFVPQNLIAKGFKLTNYEMLVISELIKRDIQQKASDSDKKYAALNDLVDLQKQYANDYQMIFNHLPEEIKQEAKNVEKANNKNNTNRISGNFVKAGSSTAVPKAKTDEAVYNPSAEDIIKLAEQYGIKVAKPQEAAQEMKDFYNGAASVNSGQQLSDAMSLINIRKNPFNGNEQDYQYSNPLNPVEEINAEKMNLGYPNFDKSIETENDRNNMRSIQEIIDAAADIQDKKAKHFFLTLAHSIYYLDSGTEGQRVLDASVRDDNGNLYQDAVSDEHEVQESLEIGLGVRVHKALDLIVTMLAENENGAIDKEGTSWSFGNVLFKFHPERLDKASIKRLNSEGIIIQDGGRVVGKRIGHSTEVLTDTEEGTTTIKAGNNNLRYDKDEGFQFSNDDSRYYIGFGKMSLNLSTYTLQLSDCKAVKVGYHDNDQELLLLYGRPNEEPMEGYTTADGNNVAGKYQKDIVAAQYIAKNIIPNMQLTFNFAKAEDKGILSMPNGTQKGTDTVYSLLLKGGSPSGKTSYEGEIAHIKNIIHTDKGDSVQSANADYLDVNHQFSDKLSGNLHLINIDGNYDASSLVEDKTGEGLLTTTKGDGNPDYLYKAGQRGLDLNLEYSLNNSTTFAFEYNRYQETQNGNSQTEFAFTGNKQWSLGGNGTVSLQQHFGYNNVSNRSYINKSSDTTVSYSGNPWKDGTVSADVQRTVDEEKGNETRYDLTAAHEFKPVERVTITPKVQYERKKGEKGREDTNVMDTTTIINSVTVGYELVPDELTVNFLVSKEKYDIISSEIDEATGKKIDGERRNTLGMGLGLAWEPNKIAGLTIGVSYRRDKVDYIERQDNSNQDVWEYSLEYSRPISDKIRASIAYDYRSARDKIKPIYDDVTRDISASIDARIGHHSSIQLQHEYSSEYKPIDSKANTTTHTTTLQMVNRF